MSNKQNNWTKERVEPGIYKRVSPAGEVRYFVQVRTCRGEASGTHRTLTQAREWRVKVLGAIADGRYFGGARGAAKVTTAKAVEDYLTAKGVTRESDVARYARAMFWSDKFGRLPVREVDGIRVAKALAELEQRVSGPTVRRYASVLSAMWKWWSKVPRRFVHAAANPVREVELPEDSKLREVTLSKAQRDTLLATCADDAELHAAVVVAILSGIRHGELARLQWKDVSLHSDHATAILRDTKNGDSRTAAFAGAAFTALKSLPRGIGNAPVFSQRITDRNRLRSLWRVVVAKAGLVGFRWHDLRHVAAQLQVESGGNTNDIMHHLGHRSAAASRRYQALEKSHRIRLAERAGSVL